MTLPYDKRFDEDPNTSEALADLSVRVEAHSWAIYNALVDLIAVAQRSNCDPGPVARARILLNKLHQGVL